MTVQIPVSFADLRSKVMTTLDPEAAHLLTVKLMSKGVGPKLSNRLKSPSILQTELAGIKFPNPLGLAAGFDKNAQAIHGMLRLGFGFVEAGGVTPLPQPGNDRPRVFRLRGDQAVINRYGFNNDGLEVIAQRMAKPRHGIAGINLGANKNSEDRIEDYLQGLKSLDGLVAFYAINISSPNTPGLRALQDKNSLDELLKKVVTVRNSLNHKVPVFLKVAPDLSDEDKTDISASIVEHGIDALVVSNTTIARPLSLTDPQAEETGGLSGAPLFEPSTKVLSEFYRQLNGAVPLIGVGGVSSGRDAYKKIRNGASLVQLYTALIYKGPGLVRQILRALPRYLVADGFSHVSEAVGVDVGK